MNVESFVNFIQAYIEWTRVIFSASYSLWFWVTGPDQCRRRRALFNSSQYAAFQPTYNEIERLLITSLW